MENKKQELAGRMAELFALPPGMAVGQCHIELLGDRGFYMEGHEGILSYGTERIELRAPGMGVCLEGKELALRAMSGREVHISGKIDAVRFLR